MPYSPKAIANYFLDLARANGDSISPMKLQKLVYYANGWYAGYTGNSLINEAVEAWQYGPVIPSLYHEFKRFGGGPITSKACDFDPSNLEFVEVPLPADTSILAFLANVWTSYGKYTGLKLSEMTHAQGGPWDETWKHAQGVKGADIPLSLIVEHFRVAIDKSKAAAAA
jgi:uncharacterized phage-associated protein